MVRPRKLISVTAAITVGAGIILAVSGTATAATPAPSFGRVTHPNVYGAGYNEVTGKWSVGGAGGFNAYHSGYVNE